ncbi:hypothetical protein HPB48_012886 [Haemaphysalis longicornis]|uniref:Uncharacterized protein n=1 Tax=Haemaphysalis longicornis TaxID=44386 RepID=A0A9J6GV57_HAELO|nr:hypothetical protein HPB48_012886 [Haemaphysalis longicornis]
MPFEESTNSTCCDSRKAARVSEHESALNQKVAEMVALDLQPYSFVEDRGFKALMSEAVPGYHLPSRTTLSCVLIPRLYDDTRAKVRAELRKALKTAQQPSLYKRYLDVACQRELHKPHVSFSDCEV